jgi:hypothetical protein
MAPHNGGGRSSFFGYHTGILTAVTCNNLRKVELLCDCRSDLNANKIYKVFQY